jgi:C4-dicarboxylate-specific signal transduction histidine kinase
MHCGICDRDLAGRRLERSVTTSYDRAASEVTIQVHDDGPGIPAATVTRLIQAGDTAVPPIGISAAST